MLLSLALSPLGPGPLSAPCHPHTLGPAVFLALHPWNPSRVQQLTPMELCVKDPCRLFICGDALNNFPVANVCVASVGTAQRCWAEAECLCGASRSSLIWDAFQEDAAASNHDGPEASNKYSVNNTTTLIFRYYVTQPLSTPTDSCPRK